MTFDRDFRVLSRSTTTGVLSGGLLASTASPTAFMVNAGVGVIVDDYTFPLNPTITRVEWDALEVEVEAISSATVTEVAIASNGMVIQQQSPFTEAQHQELIVLGRVVHSDLATVTLVLPRPDLAFGLTSDVQDFIAALGTFNVAGNTFGPAANDLTLSKSSGKSWRKNINAAVSPQIPSITNDPAIVSVPFRYTYRDGTGGWTRFDGGGASRTAVVPNLWDDGSGTLQTVPNRRWSIQPIFFFPGSNGVFIQFGQEVYNNLSRALSHVALGALVDPNLHESTQRAWLVVRGDTTDLSSANHAQFVSSGRFGIHASGGALDVLNIGTTVTNIATAGTTFLDEVTNEVLVLVDATLGAVTASLPAPSSKNEGHKVIVKDEVGLASVLQPITVQVTGGSLISGVLTSLLTSAYQSSTFISDGSSWHAV